MSGTAVSSEPHRATKNAPLMPRWTSGKPEGLDDEEEAHRLGRPDEPGQDDEDRHLAERDGAEDALLEPVVELDDAVRQGQAQR